MFFSEWQKKTKIREEIFDIHVVDYDNGGLFAPNKSFSTDEFKVGMEVYNEHLDTYGFVEAITAYPYACYNGKGEYIGFGDDYGIVCLYIVQYHGWNESLEQSATYWFIDDCVPTSADISEVA